MATPKKLKVGDPVLFYGKPVKAGSVGRRETFADIGQSIAAYHGLPKLQYGTSFL